MTRLWRFLSSMSLGVWCGLGLTALLAVSSLQLIYQGGLDDLGNPPLVLWLAGRQNLSAVWWIFGLLAGAGLFCLNTICCTIESLRQILPGILSFPNTDISLPQMDISSSLAPDEIARKAKRILQKRGFRTTCKSTDNGLILAADRGCWWLISPQVAHIGLIVLLGGLLMSATGGFKLQGFTLQPGRWQSIPEADLSLLFTGRGIEIRRNGELLLQRMPKINRPIFFNGVGIYFAGESQQIEGIKLGVKQADDFRLIRLKAGEEYEIEPGIKLVLGEIIPDFRLGRDRQSASVSSEYRNPAVRLSLKDHGRLVEDKWLLVYFPDFSRLRYKKWDIRLHSAEWVTGLQIDIARNPGVGVALAGGLLLVLGLAWNLLGSFDKIYMRIIPAAGEGSLSALSGSSETVADLQNRL